MHEPLLEVDLVSLEHLFPLKYLVLLVVLGELHGASLNKFFLINLMLIAGSTASQLFFERQLFGWRFFTRGLLVFRG